jgi:hypothetical protein
VDDKTRDALEQLADARGTNVSELVRTEIDRLIGKDVLAARDTPRSMGVVQRQTLALLHEILALGSSDDWEANHHRRRVEALREGFTAEYDREFTAMEPELAPSECRLVFDILDMFRVLEASVARLGPDDLAGLGDDVGDRLGFQGFDLNDQRESRLLSYVTYLVNTDRWTELKDRLGDDRDGGNSHMPELAIYERMLGTFRPIWEAKLAGRGGDPDSHLLGVTELHQVLDARRYPGNTA